MEPHEYNSKLKITKPLCKELRRLLREDKLKLRWQGNAKLASKAENFRTYCKFDKIGNRPASDLSDHEHEKSEH